MFKVTTHIVTVLVMLILSTNTVMAAQETLKGRLYSVTTQNLMPLGNGEGAISVLVQGVVAMGGDSPSLYGVNCVGVGLQDLKDKVTSTFYCTFKSNEEDRFDVKGKVIDGKGDLEIIGGSGKYAGATGKGKYQRLADGEEGQGMLEFKIRTK